jgi:hypothetical protein
MKSREHTALTVMFRLEEEEEDDDDDDDNEDDADDDLQQKLDEDDLVRRPLALLLFSPKRGNMVEMEDE